MDTDRVNFSLRVLDPKNKEFFSQKDLKSKGKLSFTTYKTGLHRNCFAPMEGTWTNMKKKVRFAIRLSSGEFDYEIAHKENLDGIQILIMKLKEHAEDFIKMQEKNREEESIQVEVSYVGIISVKNFIEESKCE